MGAEGGVARRAPPDHRGGWGRSAGGLAELAGLAHHRWHHHVPTCNNATWAANRAQRPGLSRIVACLFQVTVVALIFALVNGEHFSSYYIFYGSFFFAVVYVGSLRAFYEWATGAVLRAAGYRRRTVLVGSGKQIEAVAHALTNGGHPIELVGYASPTPRPDNGLRSLGAVEDLPAVLAREQVDEVLIADPDFPEQRGVALVDECHRLGVKVP